MSSETHTLHRWQPVTDFLVLERKARWGRGQARGGNGPSQKGAAEFRSGPGPPGLQVETHHGLGERSLVLPD